VVKKFLWPVRLAPFNFSAFLFPLLVSGQSFLELVVPTRGHGGMWWGERPREPWWLSASGGRPQRLWRFLLCIRLQFFYFVYLVYFVVIN
jgi:hypothetical protein